MWKGMGRQLCLWQPELMPALWIHANPPDGWCPGSVSPHSPEYPGPHLAHRVMGNATTPQIPGQRRGRKGHWFADARGCGYGPSCKERGEEVAVAVSRRRGSWVKSRKESGQNHAEDSLCMSGGTAGRQGRVCEGCEEDRHIALQEKAFSAVS